MGRPLSPTPCCGAKPTLGVAAATAGIGTPYTVSLPPLGIPRLTQRSPILTHFESAPGRDLYYFALYRVLEAGILAGLLFSPLSGMLGEQRAPLLGTVVTIGYLVFAMAMLFLGRREPWLVPLVLTGVVVDIVVASLATYAVPDATAGIAMLLLFNVAAACLLLPRRLGLAVAVLATLAMGVEFLVDVLGPASTQRPVAEVIMFAVTYMAVGLLAAQAGQRARSSQALADQRGVEVANLFEVNELIIRRMRTGVLVVDADNRIKLANEAASLLLGDGSEGENDGEGIHLPQVAP